MFASLPCLFGGRAARRRDVRRKNVSTGHYAAGLEPLECRTLLAVDVVPSLVVTNDWTSGFQAELTLDNRGSTISPWRLEFDMPADIGSIWNAQIESHVGNHYTIVGASWDTTLAAGSTLSFGFVASPGGSQAAPANYVLNGTPLDGSAPSLPQLSISDVTVTEGQSGTRNAVFTASLSAAATGVVSVAYQTTDGTAQAGSDYQAASGTLSFAAGQTSRTITVAVVGDTDYEPDETLFVDLSQVSGAELATSRGTLTITNDDTAPADGDAEFHTVTDWGSGFTGQVTVHNNGSQPAADWQLEFDFAGTISTIWNAVIVSRSGNHYLVKNAGYNSTIPSGGSATFGFVAGGSSSPGLTNFVLHGSGGTQPVNQAPTAVNDAAFTSLGHDVLVNVLANDSDPDGDAISLVAAGQAAHGSVAVEGTSIRYTPSAGFTGSDKFTYQISDPSGASAFATVNVTVSDVTSSSGERMFAPYVDMTLWPTYDLVAAARDHNIQNFTLAFIVADSQNQPAWGGYTEYALGSQFATDLGTQIDGVRALGGDVIVSFGGAANQELALVISDPAALQQAYQSVIDAYGLTHIDFDIEGAAVADRASIDRRNEAIAGLQAAAAAAGRTLDVSYTLPVLPTGLTADGLYVLQSAVARGVNVGLVNIMTMDYGDGAAPNPQGQMGDYAIQAANSLFDQLQSVYGTAKTDDELWHMVGITPMIGLNDLTTEVFDQQEAREVLAFAEAHDIGRLSFWSLNRDQQNAAGTLTYVDLKSSSILQDPFEFSQIFGVFDD